MEETQPKYDMSLFTPEGPLVYICLFFYCHFLKNKQRELVQAMAQRILIFQQVSVTKEILC